MQPPHQYSRISLAELKAQIVKKLGPEVSQQYFYYLNKLLSLKLTKVEFNKLCLRIVGRENISLHNQFIRSILKNACSSKFPPPLIQDEEVFKPTQVVGNKEPSSDGYKQNGSHPGISHASNPPAFSNGDILPLSPRKTRSGIRDRRYVDRRSSLGPNGKTSFASQQLSTTHSSDFDVILENGYSTPPDLQRQAQHHQGLALQAQKEGVVSGYQPATLSVIKRSPDDPVHVNSKDQTEVLVREEGKELSARSLLCAPLGIPLCPFSVGGARRALPLASSSKCVSSVNSGGLLDTVTLRERMEQIAATQGLEGVPMDCANLLNNGLDAFLKGLIRSCLELKGASSGHEPMKNSTHKHRNHFKLVNGVRPSHHYQMQNINRPLQEMQEHRPHCPISLVDFRVAMELNPQQLGEDWPLLLEQISGLGLISMGSKGMPSFRPLDSLDKVTLLNGLLNQSTALEVKQIPLLDDGD
ncbi:unnamed protein product [Ilex paraguariensis]|uniref:Transcriptional coactivator Hfi1/Transcriptional adapter 1 n=1 Tax=Ilex paraguariensis TaxID=185542 RepID=A0ABC8V0J9_9AQUA